MLEPVAVALKFGFIAVLYIFLLWVVISISRDLGVGRRADSDNDIRSAVFAAEPESAAGANVPIRGRLIVEKGKGIKSGSVIDIERGLTIGRASSCDLTIDDGYISHRHVQISGTGDQVYIEDMGSTNGSYVNGKLLESKVLLRPKDTVQVGGFEFRYEL